MYADSIMLHILDAGQTWSPRSVMNTGTAVSAREYYDYVNQSVENMVRTGRIGTAAVYMASSGKWEK